MDRTTLLERLHEVDGDYYLHRKGANLDVSLNLLTTIGEAYHDLDRTTLNGDPFTLHKECNGLEKELAQEYEGLVRRFRYGNISRQDDSWLRRLAVKTSEWYHSVWVAPEVNFRGEKDYTGNLIMHGVFNAAFGAAVAGVCLIGETTLGSGPVSVGCAGMLGYGLFWNKTELRGVRYERTRLLTAFLEDTYRLHYVAQVVLERVKDIEVIDRDAADLLLAKHGRDHVYASIEKAKTEVERVVEYTSQVLGAAQVACPVLNLESVSHGEKREKVLQHDQNRRVKKRRRA